VDLVTSAFAAAASSSGSRWLPRIGPSRADQLRRLLAASRPGSPWGRARVLQAEAVLAAFDGDHDLAVDAAMRSIEICESLGHVFDPIRSRIIAARSLIALARDDEARSLLAQAIADAESIGAGPLAADARSLLGHERQRRAAER
jgi:hypothetical protein